MKTLTELYILIFLMSIQYVIWMNLPQKQTNFLFWERYKPLKLMGLWCYPIAIKLRFGKVSFRKTLLLFLKN
ncbi:hypothetical protein FKQ51_31105 [Bacillus toyonensis]|nr:hypothetical protein [Bacillus toyonensis]